MVNIEEELRNELNIFLKTHDLVLVKKTQTIIIKKIEQLPIEDMLNSLLFSENELVRNLIGRILDKNRKWKSKHEEILSYLDNKIKSYKKKNTLLLMTLLRDYKYLNFKSLTNSDLFSIINFESNWFLRKLAISSIDLADNNIEPIIHKLKDITLNDSDWRNRNLALEQLIKINTDKSLNILDEIYSVVQQGEIVSAKTLDGKTYREIFLEIIPNATHMSLEGDYIWSIKDKDLLKKREEEVNQTLVMITTSSFRKTIEQIESNPECNYRNLLLKRISSKNITKLSNREKLITEYVNKISTLNEYGIFHVKKLTQLNAKEAIPDLLCLIIERKSSKNSIITAIEALTKMRSKEIIPYLISIEKSCFNYYFQPIFLRNEQTFWSLAIRIAAIKALGNLKAIEALPVLKESFLQHAGDFQVEKVIGEALADIGTIEAFEILVEGINKRKSRKTSYFHLIVKGLSEKRDYVPVWEAIGIPTKKKQSSIHTVIEALERFGLKSIPFYIKIIEESSDYGIKGKAINKLVKMRAKEAIPILRDLTKDRYLGIREEAEKALFELEKDERFEEWIKLLENYLFSSSPIKLEKIVEFFTNKEIKASKTIPEFYNELKKYHNKFGEIIEAFQKKKLTEIEPELRQLIKQTDYPILRFLAVKYAGIINPNIIIEQYGWSEDDEILELISNEEDQIIHVLICCILQRENWLFYDNYEFSEYLSKITKLKKHHHSYLLEPIMIRMLHYELEKEWEGSTLGPSAAEILGAIGAKKAIPDLCNVYSEALDIALDNAQYNRGYNKHEDAYRWLRQAIMEALKKIGIEQNNTVFLKALEDPHYKVQIEALKGISRYKVRNSLPSLLLMHFSYLHRDCIEETMNLVEEALVQLEVPVNAKIPKLAFSLALNDDYLHSIDKNWKELPTLTKNEIIELFVFISKDLINYGLDADDINYNKITQAFVKYFNGKKIISELIEAIELLENSIQKEKAKELIERIQNTNYD